MARLAAWEMDRKQIAEIRGISREDKLLYRCSDDLHSYFQSYQGYTKTDAKRRTLGLLDEINVFLHEKATKD